MGALYDRLAPSYDAAAWVFQPIGGRRLLDRARRRADRLGLSKVTLVQADVRDFEVPRGTTAVLATSSLEIVPEHDAVISALAERLAPTGRIAVVGLRHPERWPAWAIALARTATAAFGVTRAYEQIKPWESVGRHFAQVHNETALDGAMYLVVGRARPDASSPGRDWSPPDGYSVTRSQIGAA